jgi:hypothetical protein
MALVDKWTLWHIVITVAAIVLALFSKKKYKEEDLADHRA